MSYRFRLPLGTRQQQIDGLRKQGWHVLNIKAAPVVVAFKPNADGQGAVWAKVWRGNADKPAFYNHYRSMASAEANVAHYVKNVQATCASMAERRAATKAKRDALKASDLWTAGDVFYNSWGYEQTNIDWYQVVEVKAKTVVVRRIAKNYGEKGFLSGYSQPRRNEFTGDPMRKTLSEHGLIRMRHGACSKWDGKPVYESHYH